MQPSAVAEAGDRSLVPALLDEYGGLTRQALQQYLPRQEPLRHLYGPLADYPGRGGKMLRPSLCIATARAFGARLEQVLPAAVTIELFHNALLIHDDIEDESEERRGKPALHVLHGVPLAINAGDTLSLISLQPLLDNRSSLGLSLMTRLLQETGRMARESAEGQAIELGWRRDNAVDLGESDYLTMVLKKTCWLAAIYPSRVGAMIGSRRAIGDAAFTRFGFFVGAAFQIQDDLLNLIGDDAYGKEIAGDLWEGKRTLMLIRLLEQATPKERSRLEVILAQERHERRASEVRWLRELMDRYDCLEYARLFAHGLAGAALHEYSLLYSHLPDSRDKRFIRELIVWMLERKL